MDTLISLKDAAEKMGITAHSLNDWLNHHKDVKGTYCVLDKNQKGTGRKKILIHKEALLVIANMKDSFRGNNKKSGNQTLLQDGKEQLAAFAIDKASVETILFQTAKIVERLQDRVEKLEGAEPIKQLPGKAELHDPLRPLLVMLVNDYARATGAEYRDLWSLLYRTYWRTYGVDLRERAIGAGLNPLDFAEKKGHLMKLYKLATGMYRQHKSLSL